MIILKYTFVIFVCLLAPSSLFASPDIKLFAFASEPIAYYEDYMRKGIYVDILKEFGRRMEPEKNPRINIVPFKRLIKNLSNNPNGYAVTILFPNPEITPFVTQSLPVMTFKNTIISLKQTPLTWSNLRGKKIGGIRGTKLSFGEDFARMLNDDALAFIPVNRAAQGIKMLFFKRVDGYLAPEIFHIYWLNKNNCQWQSQIAEPLVLNSQTAHLMISTGQNIPSQAANKMIKKMEDTMQTLINDKFIEKVFAHYINDESKCTTEL
jgi:ABC-type amino acid transport substrate-binding protein